MNTKRYTIFLIALCGACATAAAGASESLLRDGGPLGAFKFDDADASSSRVYIVQLAEPAAATYYAANTASAMGKTAAPRFDKNNALVQNYAQQLASAQQRVLAQAGPGTQQIYSYRYALNGFAARMTPAQANKLENLPDVAAVWEDEIRPLTTNYSPEFLKLFDGDGGLRGSEGLDGDGIVIGIIDSGIATDHPSLRDRREAPQPRLC
ncbi:MAG: S8 family serine peptidase, partial [Woeseia sp.]